MTYAQLKKQLSHLPENEVNTLICHVHGISPSHLLASRDNLAEHSDKVLEYARRLDSGEPLQYILNSADFYGFEFYVDRRVLIPRFDTETLVDYCIKNIPQNTVFADICAGSGCIGISVLRHRPDLFCIFADISDSALDVCRINAHKCESGISERAKFIRFDALNAESYSLLGSVKTVVSNPPYIRSDVIPTLDRQVLHEPKLALDGGDDGLDFYRTMTANIRSSLGKDVHIIYEIGYDQAQDLKNIASVNGYGCKILHDISGNCRVAVLD